MQLKLLLKLIRNCLSNRDEAKQAEVLAQLHIDRDNGIILFLYGLWNFSYKSICNLMFRTTQWSKENAKIVAESVFLALL